MFELVVKEGIFSYSTVQAEVEHFFNSLGHLTITDTSIVVGVGMLLYSMMYSISLSFYIRYVFQHIYR